MFRFWSSDSRGCDRIAEANQHIPEMARAAPAAMDAAAMRSLKRKRPEFADGAVPFAPLAPHAPPTVTHVPPPLKRIKSESDDGHVAAAVATSRNGQPASQPVRQQPTPPPMDVEAIRDVIQHQFSLEILLKHDELRLIDQELAKCQIALEQLRRCHLIPYPTECPTPQQMLDISSGKGAAVRPRPGVAVPKWGPPFGVLDGPYARHYAKWLIPDPVFDGPLPDWPGFYPQPAHSKGVAEGRTTRNSLPDHGKHRPVRGAAGQKLHSLPSPYAQPKEKAGPCILKRSDGQTVKLVCIDCHRENFSSTQGFINHCRIAHKRDFKSHDEAAIHCGHPIEVDDTGAGGTVGAAEERPTAPTSSSVPTSHPAPPTFGSSLVHPLARSDKETSQALLSRIADSLKLCTDGKVPGVTSVPVAPARPASVPSKKSSPAFVGSDKTPYLSRLMEGKKFTGNLSALVDDATSRDDDEDDAPSPEYDSEDPEQGDRVPTPTYPSSTSGVRTPAVMRVPVRPTMTPAGLPTVVPRPASSKGRSPRLSFSMPGSSPAGDLPSAGGSVEDAAVYGDDEMDADLSPNTTASNNAPSLVSDDGEYDDSDDGSSSEVGDSEPESVSDVAEINIDEDGVQVHHAPGALRHRRGSNSTAVKLKKDEAKHVTFMSPVRGGGKGRRKQKP